MRLTIQDQSPSPTGRRLSVAFLHEGKDPAASAPPAVREELRQACRASGFGGRDKEVAGALTERGGWVLVGLDPAGTPPGEVRRALRRAIKDGRRQAGRALRRAFGDGIAPARMRAVLREIAQGDSRFQRYKSSTPPAKSPAPASAIVIPPPSIPARQLQDAAAEALALAGIV